MRADKRKKLERAGWVVGSAADFLELSPAEEALIEVKLKLSETLKKIREDKRISQQKLAEIVGSSQSRIAKMEAGDSSVSMDLLVKSIFATGASATVVATAIAGRRGVAAKRPARKSVNNAAARRNNETA